MIRKLLVAVTVLALSACAQMQAVKDTFDPSPEARIVNVANVRGAAAALGTVLLNNKKITVAKAKSYSAILHTAGDHLNSAEKDLIACRSKTASTAKSNPDPCASTVAADIALAFSIASDVKKTLEAK